MIAVVRPFALAGLAALPVAGCSSPIRLAAVPPGRTAEVTIPGIPDARYWPGYPVNMQHMVDVYEEQILKEEAAGATVDAAGNLPPAYFLAVSGAGYTWEKPPAGFGDDQL